MHDDCKSLLDRVTCSLSDEFLSFAIDRPLDAATDSFEPDMHAAEAPKAFGREVARFVQHLLASGIKPPRHVSEASAFWMATRLLAASHGRGEVSGYDAALADVMADGGSALGDVLLCILDSMKREKRAEYSRWIMYQTVESLDWRDRCRLVEAIRSVNMDVLPEQLTRLPADSLVHALSILIRAVVEARDKSDRFLVERRPPSRNNHPSLPL
jgi:hypothetical protein